MFAFSIDMYAYMYALAWTSVHTSTQSNLSPEPHFSSIWNCVLIKKKNSF